ncbi:MAG: hypothetical protein COS94_02805 [Candidatus Hydrogenedentes bacterium CG07_land_8_20_14_0_80_42_17]|nr:MAG: hypothetical protein COS94_02805 [Candidatus Hydrogenedentes bacterium CG07_land_8_20_14_0_80_42_17]
MKSISLYSRIGTFLLATALLFITVFGIGVIAVQTKAIWFLSNRMNETSNQLMLMHRKFDQVKTELESRKDTDRHLAVSIKENKLYLMEGDDILRIAPVATGSGRKFKFLNHEYDFSTPVGTYSVLRKETDPVWIAPDWNWHEKGETVPLDLTLEKRKVRGVMGKYALRLGNGYAIHGTNQLWSIGRYTSHGCIRVGDKDLKIIFNAVDTGSKVYIY